MKYNTDFKVKYRDIHDELIFKLNSNPDEQLSNYLETDCKYSDADISVICEKLYIDELMSVFNVEDILDDKIDIGMRYVLEQMILNNDFKQIVNDFEKIIIDSELCSTVSDAHLIIILTSFQQNVFYLFHKCICQQLTLGTIEPYLLDEYKKHITNAFNL